MREIIKTYKNFDTGITEEVRCIKPSQSITGHYKVELFNARSGRKVEECEGENLITNSLNKYWTLFNYVVSNCVSQTQYDNSGQSLPFGNIYLTSSTAAENVNTNRVLGNVIGWANRSNAYSGTDIYRGTINLAESGFTGAGTIKRVFDWSTHAGNGTFQSLFWTMGNQQTVTTQTPPLIGQVMRMSTFSNSVNLSDSNSRTCVRNDEIYYTAASGIIYKYTRVPTSYGFNTVSTLFVNMSASDNDIQGVEWDGTNFWVFGDQNDKMYKLDTSGNVVTSWSITKATYFDTWVRFTCFGGKIYTFKRNDATTWNLYKFATDGTLENTYNLYSAGRNITDSEINSSSCSFCNDGNSMFLLSTVSTPSLSVFEFDGSGNVLYDFESEYQSSALPGYSACFDLNSKLLHFHSTTSGGYASNFTGFEPLTQTLLPASITKTSTQTMKITYTFNFSFS